MSVSVADMEVDGQSHGLDCVLKVRLANCGVIYKYRGAGAVLLCEATKVLVLKFNNNTNTNDIWCLHAHNALTIIA